VSQEELLEKIRASRQSLLAVLERIPPAERELPGACGEWSVKDAIVHLNYWEGETVTMLYQLRQRAPLSTVHFTHPVVDEVNQRWHLLGKDRSWERAWADFQGIHAQMLRRVASFSEGELNRPDLHPKLEKTPLWHWIARDTYQHEDEHSAILEAWLKVR
jgi:hypothetical protein